MTTKELSGFNAAVRAIIGSTPRAIRTGKTDLQEIGKGTTILPVITIDGPDPVTALVLLDESGAPFLARLDMPTGQTIGGFYYFTTAAPSLSDIEATTILPVDLARSIGVPEIDPREQEAAAIHSAVQSWQAGIQAAGIPESLAGALWTAQRGSRGLPAFDAPPDLRTIRAHLGLSNPAAEVSPAPAPAPESTPEPAPESKAPKGKR